MEPITENFELSVSPSAAESPAMRPGIGIRVFQNTVAMLAGRGVGLALSAGTSVLLARYLGRERLGEYGAIYAYLALYAFLATFCLEQILAREVSVRRDKAAVIFRTGTLTALGFSICGTIVAPLLAPLFGYSGSLRWLIVVAAVDLLILPPFKLSGIVFQVDMRLWYAVAIGLSRQALWLAAVILLTVKSAAFYQVILARTFCGVIELAVVLWTIRRLQVIQGPGRFLPEEAWRMLRDGFPLVLTTLAVGIYHRIDQVMLHKMSGDGVLGPYVIAVQLTELFSALPVALMSSLFPALSQAVGDPSRFNRYLKESYRFLLVIVFAACALVTPVAAPVVELFYGSQFLPTANLLIVLIWSEVPVFFAVALSGALIARNLQRYTPYSSAAGALANILLNLWLIPKYGALGASWATVVSYSISGIFVLLFFAEIRPMALLGLRIALTPFLLALAATLALGFMPIAFWWKLLLSAMIYGTGAILTGTLNRGDFQRLGNMFRLGISNG